MPNKSIEFHPQYVLVFTYEILFLYSNVYSSYTQPQLYINRYIETDAGGRNGRNNNVLQLSWEEELYFYRRTELGNQPERE